MTEPEVLYLKLNPELKAAVRALALERRQTLNTVAVGILMGNRAIQRKLDEATQPDTYGIDMAPEAEQ